MTSDNAPPKILVIDDDVVTSEVLRAQLSVFGYDIICADSAETGFEYYRNRDVDVVLLDIVMPGMGGIEACQLIKDMEREHKAHVLMMTSLEDDASIQQAFLAGADDFLLKPVNYILLNNRLRYFLKLDEMRTQVDSHQQYISDIQKLAHLGYWSMDVESGYVRLTGEAAQMLGVDVEHVSNLDECLANFAENDRGRFSQMVQTCISSKEDSDDVYRLLIDNESGREIYMEHRLRLVTDKSSGSGKLVGTIQDVTQRILKQHDAFKKIFVDAVTELPNRANFELELEKVLLDCEKHQKMSAVILFSIDKFEMVNDSFGHAGGDEVLRAVAGRIKTLIDDNVIVARFGTKTYSALFYNLDHVDTQKEFCEKLLETAALPFVVAGEEITLGLSVGATLFPLDTNNSNEVLKQANIAMTHSRKQGNAITYFTNDMRTQALSQLTLENRLRDAISNDEFVVYYQPQIDVRTGEMVGAEALVRWHHPDMGVVPPDQFIPLAEESGLIISIGSLVMMKACMQMREWNRNVKNPLRVSVNLSTKQLMEDEVLNLIQQILYMSRLEPNLLEVEITETVAVENLDATIALLQKIRRMGVKVALDDFGTGYSSLSILQRLPLDTLKVDRAFVKDINEQGENGEFCRAIVVMAKSLGLHLVAEGVETIAQRDFLRGLEVDEVQGYFYSRPLSVPQFEEYLRQSHLRLA